MRLRPILLGLLFLVTGASLPMQSTAAEPTADELKEIARLNDAQAKWEKAGRPGPRSEVTKALIGVAVTMDRSVVVENVLTGGKLKARRIPIPRGGKTVVLREVRRFSGINAILANELLHGDWVARRMTTDRLEVWTATHGWLLDGAGRLVAEANVVRQGGTGREWHGAFLPNGQWITTQITENDSTLSFFTAKGELSRVLKCSELAMRTPEDDGFDLIGWARSDQEGNGWVVNVGSEYGYATVWVGPDGPARRLTGIERWERCNPRALGPRGTVWSMAVPDDKGEWFLERREANHGKWVGYPTFTLEPIDETKWNVNDQRWENLELPLVPSAHHVFGFWPGKPTVFIGAESIPESGPDKTHTRKWTYIPERTATGEISERGSPIVDKTWFFDGDHKCSGWIAGRRIGDAADGKSLLFRLTADSRVAVLKPDLTLASIRRMQWKDGTTADAFVLWDDLRRGLFVRDRNLVLAAW
jgi:hypothetical protein